MFVRLWLVGIYIILCVKNLCVITPHRQMHNVDKNNEKYKKCVSTILHTYNYTS